jgi:hypothetical protein
MSNITHEHVQHLHKRGESLYRRLEALKEKLSGTTAKAVRTLEVSTAALVGGVIQGKAGPDGAHIMHVPVDLGAGLLLNLLGYFDAAGDEYSEHLNNFGDGFLGAYLSSLGFGMGKAWKETGKFSLTTKTPAQLPTAAAGTISPDQMQDIIARVRASGG